MKYLKLFEDYKINTISKYAKGKFQYCDGIKYKLGNGEHLILNINVINPTIENTFYPDQIERYKEYIYNGGVIESFPIEEVSIANNLKDMLEWIEENSDVYYNLFYDTPFYQKKVSNMDREINKALGKDEAQVEIPEDLDSYTLFDKEEHPEYARINKNSYNLEEVFPENKTKEEKELLKYLKPVFDYFDEEKKYYLLDFNHRFEAVKELGKKSVIVEIMK